MTPSNTRSWRWFLIEMSIIIGVVEMFIMLGFAYFPHPTAIEIVLDPILIAIFAGPVILWRTNAYKRAQVDRDQLMRKFDELQRMIDEHTLFSITDKSGRIIEVNNGFCAISGYSREELIGQDHRMLNSGHHPKSFWKEMWATIAGGAVWRGEVCNRAKDGSLYWVAATNYPRIDEQGKACGYISLRLDITESKKMSENYRRTRLLLNQTGRIASVGGWELDFETMELHWSDEVYHIHDLEIGNKPSLEDAINYYAPEARPIIQQAVDDGIKEGRSWDLELPLITAKGRRRWVRAMGEPIFENGRCVKLTGAFQDITAQYESHRRLEQAESRLSMAINAAGIGLWEWDIINDGCYFSDTYYTMLGYEPGAFPMGFDSWESLMHPEDLSDVKLDLSRYLCGESGDYAVECRMKHHDGSWVWVRTHGEIVDRDDEQNPARMVGVQVDINHTKRLNKALEQIVEMETMPTLRETCIELSRHTAEFFDVDFAAVVSFPEAEQSEIAELIGGVHKGCDISGIEYELIGTPCYEAMRKPFTFVPDRVAELYPGDKMLVELGARSYAGVRLQDNKGRTVGLLVLLHSEEIPSKFRIEATMRIIAARAVAEIERHQVEKGLQRVVRETEEASRAKSEFLANMSHEIRTPMTAILGYTDLILDPASNALDFTDHVDTIKSNASHLMTVINDILDMSKIESGRMEIEQLECDPAQIINETCSIMRPNAEGKGIKFEVELDDSMPARVVTDPTRFRQILLNLQSNAIKFTEDGVVLVRADYDRERDQLSIAVKDTGIGMCEKQRERIAQFDAFTQADGSTARRFGGSGLGLRISSMLADLLGGGISIESEDGVGSTFTLTIHAGAKLIQGSDLDHAQGQDTTSEILPGSLNGARILLAEDGKDNQRLITILLERVGAEVRVVSNGLEAINTLSEPGSDWAPDLVLMDMQMPEVDGYEATARLRRSGCTLPIIALTAHAMASDRSKCLDAGCDEYLAKPIDRDLLVSLCHRFIQRTSDRAEAA